MASITSALPIACSFIRQSHCNTFFPEKTTLPPHRPTKYCAKSCFPRLRHSQQHNAHKTGKESPFWYPQSRVFVQNAHKNTSRQHRVNSNAKYSVKCCLQAIVFMQQMEYTKKKWALRAAGDLGGEQPWGHWNYMNGRF